MKARTRVKKPIPMLIGATVRFVGRPDAGMLVIREPAEVDTADVCGAYVKFMPTIRVSERASLDSTGIAARLRERGAIAVVVVPVVIADRGPSKADEKRVHKSAEQWISAWLDAVRGVEREVALRALAEAMASADEAGL